jgi:hypothetical protein
LLWETKWCEQLLRFQQERDSCKMILQKSILASANSTQ